MTIYDAEVVKATEKALLVRGDDLDEDLWVPRSVIKDESPLDPDAVEGDQEDLEVKKWWAEKEGLA
jgi:hypothetical protein